MVVWRDLSTEAVGVEDLAATVVLADLTDGTDSHLVLIGLVLVDFVQGRGVVHRQIRLGEVNRHGEVELGPTKPTL